MKKLLFAVLCLTFASQCVYAAKLVRTENIDVTLSAKSDEAVGKAIFDAAKARKWMPEKRGDNEIIATLISRNHMVAVSIVYSKDGYSIAYKDSKNMNYNARRKLIHSKYKQWIETLNKDITNKFFAQNALEF
ncbi:MAG: hypothetical protein LBQ47_05625 [Endomicrobium sp.]|jgi:hypothetical protein|nr:hypothetical protein [Endomicrobium sp.]